MDEPIKTVILPVIKERFSGRFDWLISELASLVAAQGAENYRGTLNVGGIHGHYAPCVIYAPIVQSLEKLPIPKHYADLLRRFNGAKFYAIDFFGILEDESNQRRCMSLNHANEFWIREYRGLPKGAFHFGARFYSSGENVGYFYDSSLRVFSAKKSGEVVSRWPSAEEMLHDEWEVSKTMENEIRSRLKDLKPGRRKR